MMRTFGLVLSLLIPWISHAQLTLNQQVVADPVPVAIAPNELGVADFEILSDEPTYEASFIVDSFEWTRIARYYLIPRARVKVTNKGGGAQRVSIRYQGITFSDQVLVALMPDPDPSFVVLDGTGTKELAHFKIKYHPRQGNANRLVVDHSCSPFKVEVNAEQLTESWVEIGCKMVLSKSDVGAKPVLELMIYWDGPNAQLPLVQDGLALEKGNFPFQSVKLTSEQPRVIFQKGLEKITLTQHVAETFHRFVLSAGLGLYQYETQENSVTNSKLVPFGTLYMSYFVSEAIKVASFWAFPGDSRFQTDVGLYMVAEQFRGVDERLSMNILLGAHMLEYTGRTQTHFNFSAPQGIELTFRDLFATRQNFSVGGFFYPTINGQSYINSWIRYGSSKLFYEVNYITWTEPYPSGSVSSESVGFSIGMPLYFAL